MREHSKEYFIKCERCDEILIEADSLQKILEVLFNRLASHNITDREICSEAKDELRMDDVRGAFASEMWQVYKAEEHEMMPVEWRKAGHGGLQE